jgi:hypothetical protein
LAELSLAAAVYIKRSHISIEWLDDTLSVDEVTGEVVSETFHIPAKAKEAIAYRLGNGKYIEHCRQEIEKVAKGRGLAMPILLEHVLAGEIQPGDVVSFADVPKLKRELKFLERTPKFSTDARELLFRLNKLVEAAEANRNPIAFK